MDTLIARLTDLAYEIFGILAPGVLALVTFVFLWAWSGDLLPKEAFQTTDALMQGTYAWLVHGHDIHWSLAVIGLIVSYILGHALKFLAKEPARFWVKAFLAWVSDRVWPFHWPRKVWLTLSEAMAKNVKARSRVAIKIINVCSTAADAFSWLIDKLIAPKQPTNNFNEKLNSLLHTLKAIYIQQGGHTGDLPWVGFFPMARARIAKGETKSYLTTFQNSYTFHRSLATLATISMWASALCLTFTEYADRQSDEVGLWFLLLASFGSKQVFTANFRYFWGLWGNQVITEAYALEIERHGSDSLPSPSQPTKPVTGGGT